MCVLYIWFSKRMTMGSAFTHDVAIQRNVQFPFPMKYVMLSSSSTKWVRFKIHHDWLVVTQSTADGSFLQTPHKRQKFVGELFLGVIKFVQLVNYCALKSTGGGVFFYSNICTVDYAICMPTINCTISDAHTHTPDSSLLPKTQPMTLSAERYSDFWYFHDLNECSEFKCILLARILVGTSYMYNVHIRFVGV